MTDSHLIRLVLRHLYTLAQKAQPATLGRLARDLDQPRAAIAQALLTLDRAGLVDCSLVRLTLSGLAVAVALPNPRRAVPAPRRAVPRAAPPASAQPAPAAAGAGPAPRELGAPPASRRRAPFSVAA